jgi:phage FluMu gp28-like protein
MDRYRRVLPLRDFAALDAWLSQFYQFQLRWLCERSKRAACVKARQIGWSHTTAACGVIWGALHGELTTIISKGEEESREVLDKARRHADVLVSLGCALAKPRRSTSTAIEFASGGRLLALPSTGGRGYTGNLILDEYAYHQHQKETWDAAVPAMRLGDFRLRVISTPNGVGDEYSNLVSAIESGKLPSYALHRVTIDDAIADGFPVDLDECWADAKGDPRLFDQLYRGKFLDGELQYISGELIESCSTDDLNPKGEAQYFAGLDIGKTVDRTVLLVVKRVGGVAFTHYIETCKRTDDEKLQLMVDTAMKRFSLRRLVVDATGMGTFPADVMRKRHGASKIEPVVFTQQSKEDMATALYTAFAKRTVMIPKTKLPAEGSESQAAEKLRLDIASIRRIITTAGNVRYDAPHTNEGHADRAWALAMAVHAASNAPSYATV